MQVRIRLFAAARQIVDSESIEIDLPANSTIADLRSAIVQQHDNLADLLPHVRFAVDTEYVTDQTVIGESADIACIPPVSGG